jgi:cell cycle arrest protein BUB3
MKVQQKKYAFKCHRKKDVRTIETTVYPVNALAFCPSSGRLASGGGDGRVWSWDIEERKKIGEIGHWHNTVASLAYSPSGDHIAVALSYTYEKGDIQHDKDQIVIKQVPSFD